MAAGKYGGYRDTDFGDRESSYHMTRRDSTYIRDEYGQIRNGSRVLEHDRRISDNRGRLRWKDIKEREVMNGSGYPSSSSRSDSGGSSGGGPVGPRRCGYSLKLQDREPGELSSESGSDGAIESEPPVKDTDVPKFENGARSPLLSKKRKFSPIVWDRDDKEVEDLLKSTAVVSIASACRSTPPLLKLEHQSANVVLEEDAQLSPVKSNKSEGLQASPVKVDEVGGSADDVLSVSPVNLPYSLPPDQQWGKDEGTEQHEDEDYIPARNISSSRWAGDAESPADEGEISDYCLAKKNRKVLPSDLWETRLDKRSTPEFRELKTEGSVGADARSSDCEEVIPGRPSSGDRSSENSLNKENYMEVDDEHNSDGNRGSATDSDDENDSRETPEPPSRPLRTADMLLGCRSVEDFERLNRIDEGTYGVVYRAKDKRSGEIVALKKVKMEKEKEGFPLTSLREINILLSLHHLSIVDVKEVVVGSNVDSIFMVMEYMEHDLKGLMEAMKQPFSQSEVKCLMLQLLEGVKHLHDNWVLHRDLKTSNLLLNNRGELKICDFGLARQYGSSLKPYTHLVVTLWYRAPELLLGAKQYSTAIDMWSLGCIMAELLSKEPLFNGKTEFDQLDKIFRILGTPNETIWPGFSKLPGVRINFVKHQYNQLRKKFPATSFTGSPVLSDAGFDLLNRLLTYDPDKRITADAALNHEWFQEVPLPKSKEFMPTFPAQHAHDRRTRRIMKSPDPLEEQRRKELHQAEFGTGGLFG
ncbi:hypothetical protein Dimus_015228 [Dionaea muscipula]